jgi:ribosomal protein L7/L12
MAVVELRCPSCSAPLGPGDSGRTVCAYCGATLVVSTSPAAKARVRNEERVVIVLRQHVGPSNVAHVARVLHELGRIDLVEAETLVGSGATEIPLARDAAGARQLELALREAGATAEVISRTVAVPLPPHLAIWLDDVGPNKLAVIHAVRDCLPGLSVVDAKHLVETAPCSLAEDLDWDDGQALLGALADAGAKTRSREI